MPGFDRTGPRGQGPMTGGNRGLCAGDGREGSEIVGFGYGRGGRGGGRGMGRGRGFAWRRALGGQDPDMQTMVGDDDLRRQVLALSERVAELAEQLARRPENAANKSSRDEGRDADVS